MARSHIRSKKITLKVEDEPLARTNLLLAAMSGAESRRFLAHCEPVELTFGDVLCEQGARIRYVYFPTGGFISLLVGLDQGARLEVGLVGTEGAVGVSVALGVLVSPALAIVQGTGPALRMEATVFSTEIERSPALKRALSRYLYVLMSQLAQMAACARFHVVEARLARWLLMTRDRAGSREFYLTQKFIAYMLGVRRAGVTRAAGVLQSRRLVRYSRGRMTILNERGLAGAACACYAGASDTYTRFMSQDREAA